MGELVEFEGRNRVLGLRELENKLLLCPTDEQFRRVRHAHTRLAAQSAACVLYKVAAIP